MKFGKLSNLVENRMKLTTMSVMRFSFTDRGVQELVLDLNRDYQLFSEGVDADGNIVGYYTKFTEQMYQGQSFRGKQKMEGEKYFFLDTGSLFDSFFIRVADDGIIIGSTDIEKLSDNRYISDVADLLGLTTESKEAVIIEILPNLRAFILNTLLK
jgi:hypothetical protein